MEKNVFVILGVARSGTSAVARGLKALGIHLGNQLTTSNKWNPTGFWEDHGILNKVNGKVLAAMDCAIHDFKLIDPQQQTSSDLKEIQEDAVALLKERFAATDFWGFKDPSTVKLLPFWQAIFNTLGIRENYIITLRNPLSSAQSYANLTGAELEVGLLLWLMHIVPAIEGTFGKNRVIVNFDLLMQHPNLQLERIRKNLAIPLIPEASELDNYINGFLDKKLHHYVYTDDDLKTHPAIKMAPLCVQTYYLLMRLAKDELNLESDEFLFEWQAIKKEFDRHYPIYCYIEKLLKSNKQIVKQLRAIQKSPIFKLTYPLRMMGEMLRNYRKRLRKNKKISSTLAVNGD